MAAQKGEGRKTVKTRFLIVSDTHNVVPFDADDGDHAYRQPLPDADILLHCGDLTVEGGYNEYLRTIRMLKEHPAQYKIVIAGNHDVTLDKECYKKQWQRFHPDGQQEVDKIRELWVGKKATDAGIVYLEEGVREFGLRNGARFTIYSSPYQPEFCNWAFPYKRDEDRFNPRSPEGIKNIAVNPVPDFPRVDIIMTHGPPKLILDKTIDLIPVGCIQLMRADLRCRPLLHCFGHIHEGWGAGRMDWVNRKFNRMRIDRDQVFEDRAAKLDLSSDSGEAITFGKETLFINAAIMNFRYKPVNAPWVVDLDLPFREMSMFTCKGCKRELSVDEEQNLTEVLSVQGNIGYGRDVDMTIDATGQRWCKPCWGTAQNIIDYGVKVKMTQV